MLIGFSAENFKCFSEEISVSLIAEKQDRNCFSVGRVPVLSHIALCGGCGSGKTSLLDGLSLISSMVALGRLPENSRSWYCRSDKKNRTRDTVLELIFAREGMVYSYGVRACLSTGEIFEEWLNQLDDNGSYQLLAGRDRNRAASLARRDEFTRDDQQRFRMYAEDLPSDQLLLSRLMGLEFKEGSGLTLLKDIGLFLSTMTARLDCSADQDLKVKISTDDLGSVFSLAGLLSQTDLCRGTVRNHLPSLPCCVTAEEAADLVEGQGIVCIRHGRLILTARNDSGIPESSEILFTQPGGARLGFGDLSGGAAKLTRLAMFLSSTENQVLLVDDIDDHLGLDDLTGLYSAIENDSKKSGRQVVFTTRDSEQNTPVYSLAGQNVFHMVRQDAHYFLMETRQQGGESSYLDDNFGPLFSSQDREQPAGNTGEKDNARQSAQESEFTSENASEKFLHEEDVAENYHSLAADLPQAAPLDDRESERWNDGSGDDFPAPAQEEPQSSEGASDNAPENAEGRGRASNRGKGQRKGSRRSQERGSRGQGRELTGSADSAAPAIEGSTADPVNTYDSAEPSAQESFQTAGDDAAADQPVADAVADSSTEGAAPKPRRSQRRTKGQVRRSAQQEAGSPETAAQEQIPTGSEGEAPAPVSEAAPAPQETPASPAPEAVEAAPEAPVAQASETPLESAGE